VLASFDSHLFWSALSSSAYWRGALRALELTAVSLSTAIVLGFFIALGSLSARRGLRSVSWIYNWLFRATPTLLQLFLIWYALPQVWSGFAGSWFTVFAAAWIALSLNESAYVSEIIRAGLLSVEPGQELAGRALGMKRRQIMRRVIVPQAVRIVIPPLGNEFITLIKLTSLAYIISFHEIFTSAQELSVVKFKYAEPMLAALLYYLAIVSVLMILQARLERKFTWTSGRRRRFGTGLPSIGHG
jgi:His/Glu/Gln/Arg/opine family amino acid ABC transporter permease subunit